MHGGFLAVFFDCVLQQLNCDLGVAGKTAELSLRFRRPTPLLTPLVVLAERTDRRQPDPRRARELAPRRRRCSARRRCAPWPGDRAALPRVSPRRAMSAPTTVEPRRCATGVRRASRRSTTSCATTTGSRTPTPNAAAGCWRAGCSRRAPGRGSRIGLLYPTGTRLRRGVAGGGAHRRDRRPDQHVLDADRAARPPAHAPTSTCCSACPSYRGNDYVAALRRRRRARRRAAPPSAGGAVPAPRLARRRVRHARRRAPPRCRDARARRGRGRRHARRPHGDRAHVGVDERAEGRDPPARSAPPPPRQPERAARRSTRACGCSRTRRSSGSAGSRTTSSARSSPARRSLCSAAPDPAETLDLIERERPDAGERLRRVDRAPGRGPDVRRRATSRRSAPATSTRSCPTASGPPIRSSVTTCSA